MAQPDRTRARAHQRLGDVLLEAGLLDVEKLQSAYDEQRRTGEMFVDVLLRLKSIEEEALVQIIIKQHSQPFISTKSHYIDESVAKIFPPRLVYQYKFIPLDRMGSILTIVAGSVLDANAVSELERVSGLKIHVFMGRPSEVDEQIKQHFPEKPEMEAAPAQLSSIGDFLLGEPVAATAEEAAAEPAPAAVSPIPERRQRRAVPSPPAAEPQPASPAPVAAQAPTVQAAQTDSPAPRQRVPKRSGLGGLLLGAGSKGDNALAHAPVPAAALDAGVKRAKKKKKKSTRVKKPAADGMSSLGSFLLGDEEP